jgi:hypothetical protein
MRHRAWDVLPVRRRRLGFAFALVAALVSAGWDDCCCYDPPRLAEPDGGGRIKQPFAPYGYYLYPYDGGSSIGTHVGSVGWDPQLRLSTSWVGLGRTWFDDRPMNVTSVVRENDEYQYVGSSLGLFGVSTWTGSVRSFSGLPSNGPTLSFVTKRPGGVYAGLYSASSVGLSLFYQCDFSSFACSPVPGGPTSTKVGDGAFGIRIFGGATYFLSTLGMWSTPNYGMSFKESTPSANNYAIAGEDGNLIATTDNGVYKGAGRGGTWTLDNNGLTPGGCKAATYVPPTFYTVCNSPSLQVFRRLKTDTSWTSTGLNLNASGGGLEADGSDVVLGTSVGPYRLHGTAWALDDPCYKNPAPAIRIRLDGSTLGVAGPGGYSESTDGGKTWIQDPSTFRIMVTHLAKNNVGTYLGTGFGQYYKSVGGTAFNPFTIPLGNVFSLGTAGNTVLAGFQSGGVGTLAGTTFQAQNTGFDTTAMVYSFASNGTNILATTSKGNFFAPLSPTLSWTKGANRADGQPFVGTAGIALANGDYLVGGAGNPNGNIQRSNGAGTTLTPAGGGLPAGVIVYNLIEFNNHLNFVKSDRNAAAVGNQTALAAATSLGLYVSFDNAASWSLLSKELGQSPVYGLAADATHLWVATASRGLRSFALPLQFRRLVPIVLDVNSGTAHYTTELTMTNPGTTTANVAIQYTASLGSGSFTTSDISDPGQGGVTDVIAYLRMKGAPIPVGGSQGGTLLFTFTNVSADGVPAVTVRTTAATGPPLPVGRAGLAYGAIDPDEGSRGTLTVYGLRSNATDRSNFAVYNTSSEDVTFSVAAFSGDGSGASSVIAAADTLPAWGWKQYNRILEGPGYAQGWVSVTRTSTTGAFGIYGVVNDNVTNDGSLLGPGASPQMPAYTNVPVLVETGAFVSELVLADAGAAAVTFHLTYRESLTGSGGGSADVVVAAKSQLIVPSAIAYLRSHGVPIGAAGGSYAGSLHVEVTSGDASGTWVGARTSAPAPSGGNFGLFTPSATPGSEGQHVASVYGLRSDAENRSNVAVVNTGGTDDGPVTLSIQAYDGDNGGTARGNPTVVVLQPGQWQQFNNFLAGAGVTNGWVKVTRTAGFAPWIAYGVINDGGAPGQRTSDGAYVAMTR